MCETAGVKVRRCSRELVVDLVSKAGRVDDCERDAHAVFLKLCRHLLRVSKTPEPNDGPVRLCEAEHLPTLTGLILMPSSW